MIAPGPAGHAAAASGHSRRSYAGCTTGAVVKTPKRANVQMVHHFPEKEKRPAGNSETRTARSWPLSPVPSLWQGRRGARESGMRAEGGSCRFMSVHLQYKRVPSAPTSQTKPGSALAGGYRKDSTSHRIIQVRKDL